jgi:hypothetical protein
LPTILSFLSGRQITNDSGVPQAGAKLLHYRENTTTALPVWQDDAASVAHAQPVVCDAGGFVPLIYVDDTFDWKVVITTSADVTLKTYDNLPKAETDETAAGFSPPLFEWTQITSAASPVALTVNDVGNAYECDTTGGSIEFDLPDAASVGSGKGFVFKKTAAANTLTLDPSGSQTIDDATSVAITVKGETVGIYSNGAEWYKVFDVTLPIPTVQTLTSGTAATYTPPANVRFIRVRMVGGGGGGGAQITNNGANGTTTSFGSWTAILGQGGGLGAAGAGGTGGTGGANGTGTQIARFAGQNGTRGAGVAGGTGGLGGVSPFGGAGIGGDGAAGAAAKANTGSGGGGAEEAAGGGAGEYVEFFVTAPTATTYTVGAAGAGGAAGTFAGGNGAAGIIIVEEFY